jgi:cytochrome b
MSSLKLRVWDPFVRLFHWSLVTCFFIAYLSGDEENLIHIYSGYAVITLVAARLIWGFIGTRYARFSQFIYSPASVVLYLKELAAGRPRHYTGHNPAAAWMIYTLLLCLILTSLSGLKAYGIEGYGPLASSTAGATTATSGFSLVRQAHAKDYYRKAYREYYRKREDIWEEIHEFFAGLTLFLVFVHVAGAVVASRIHRENLIKAMITGTKLHHPDERSD